MKVLVIGDTILDRYIEGSVDRISPEAPVPVLQKASEYKNLGGACNVAVNIKSLSPETEVDFFGFCTYEVVQMLQAEHVNPIPVSVDEVLTKTRFVCRGSQLLRLDEGVEYDPKSVLVLEKLIKGIELSTYDCIVLSDYAKGTATESLLEYITDKFSKRIFLDLKKFKNWMSSLDLRECIIKCNEKEYRENRINILSYTFNSGFVVTEGKSGYRTIMSHTFPGEEGATYKYGPYNIDSPVVDVVGAGDVFLAGMVAKYLEILEEENPLGILYLCSDFGNAAAAVRVRKFGELKVTRKEVDEQIYHS